MAGAGYKLFTTGSVLTAADVNTYLNEQSVMRFANAAARTSALTSVLAEGMVSYLQDTNAVEVYDGSSWVGIGNSGDITGVTAGTGISGGGTSGTVTITNDMATTITASGDIIVGTGSGTYDNLPIGTTGQVLTADTTVSPYKVKWATPASSSSALTLITAQAFSSSSAVNVNSVFTSTYNNYKVIVNITDTSTTNTFSLRLRTSGSDNTNASYQYTGTNTYSDIDTVYTQRNNGTTSFARASGSGQDSADNGASNMVYEFFNPQVSLRTGMTYHLISSDGSRVVWDNGSGIFDNTTSFDGFSLIVSSGNITGTVYVYGYAKS